MYKQRKKGSSFSLSNTIAACFLLIFWSLPFFANSFTTKLTITSPIKGKAYRLVAASNNVHTTPNTADDPFESLPNSDDSEWPGNDIEDNTDDDENKNAHLIFSILETSSNDLQLVQSIQSSQFMQSIHQKTAIPLFVLHHSWKSYLL